MEIAIAVTVLVVITIVYALSSIRAHGAVEKARAEKNLIYRSCFLKGLAGILAKMAKADGVVTLDEVNLVGRLFRDMGLKDEDYRLCFDAFKTAKDSNLGMDYYAALFAPYSSLESRVLVYEILWDVAASDGRFDNGEELFLKEIPRLLELDEAHYEANRQRTKAKFGEPGAAIRSAGEKVERLLAK